jgi:hypothetical protein
MGHGIKAAYLGGDINPAAVRFVETPGDLTISDEGAVYWVPDPLQADILAGKAKEYAGVKIVDLDPDEVCSIALVNSGSASVRERAVGGMKGTADLLEVVARRGEIEMHVLFGGVGANPRLFVERIRRDRLAQGLAPLDGASDAPDATRPADVGDGLTSVLLEEIRDLLARQNALLTRLLERDR